MKKKRRKVSNIVLAAAVASVVCYTVSAAAIQLFTGSELSPTLTTAWFSFWGTEIIALAAIRTCKVKHSACEDGTSDNSTDAEYLSTEPLPNDEPYRP